jgi:hypothetical protein
MCGNMLLWWEDVVSAVCCGETERHASSLQVTLYLQVTSYLKIPPYLRVTPRLQVASETLGHWRSLVNIWLDFPRQWEPADALTEPERGSKLSFREKIKFPGRTTSLPLGLLCFHAVLQAVYFMLVFACLPFVAYEFLTFTAQQQGTIEDTYSMEDASNASQIRISYGTGSVVIILVSIPIIIGAFSISTKTHFILCGNARRDLHKLDSQASETDAPLNAIRAALRERKSSNPHDRAFALFGVLRGLGVSTSQVNYQQPVHQTYQNLFQDLLAWTPDALIILADVNLETHVNGPSWVPNWAAITPNPWLSSRYILQDAELDQGRRVRNPMFWIKDSTLNVQGHVEGFVRFQVGFDKSTEQQTEESMPVDILVLSKLLRWMYWCQEACNKHGPYEDEISYMFAVLEGLSWPQEREGNLMTIRRKPPHGMAPPNFSDRSEEFCAFEVFYKMLSSFPRNHTDNCYGAQQFDIVLSSMYRIVKANKVLTRYTQELAHRLVADRRCLFVLSNGTAGSGPLALKVGDEVFALSGVPTPMGLRYEQAADAYKVVGAVFVHGLMYGSFINRSMLIDVKLL